MEKRKGQFYLFCAFGLAGTSVVTARLLTDTLGSFTITALSLFLLIACLSPFYVKEALRISRRLRKRDWLLLILQGGLGIFAFRLFLLMGLRHTSAGEASMLTGATPAITALMAYLFLRDPLSGRVAGGIGLTVAGILLLQAKGDVREVFSAQHLGGNMLVLLAATSESAFQVLARYQKAPSEARSGVAVPPMVQTLFVAIIAFVLSLVPALLERPASAIAGLGVVQWLALFWYGLGVTALAFACMYAGVKRCNAYTAAAFTGMMPLTSVLLSVFLLRDPMSLLVWAGGVLVILGMVLIGISTAKTECRPERAAEPDAASSALP